ncbi:MAG TPA: multicopper oxidase [Bellilinea sp.]|nr:multicopper oxidase [Bellilinea sp.]
MTTRREFMKLAAMGGFGLFLPFKIDLSRVSPRLLATQFPPVNGADIGGKFSMPLIIPPAMPRTTKIKQKMAKNIDYYEIAVRQFQQQILPTGNPTTVWSYGSVNHPGTFNYPAFTIEAKYNKPTQVKWMNQLVDANSNFLPHLLAVDQTLHWANPPGVLNPGATGTDSRTDNPDSYIGPVPIVTHVHGAHVAEEYDGYPEAWYLPDAVNLQGFVKGGTWYQTFADKAAPLTGTWPAGSSIFHYPNDQRATTLWYHDHTLGMTRLNVYAGPAGFYLIRGGPSDKVLDSATGLPAVLPGPAPALGDLPGVQYYEIPIAIQDRCFDEFNQLWYPDNRAFFEGLAQEQLQIPFIPADACDGPSDISPIWNPEFFGNVMVVNGHAWPFQNVEAKRYRFRFLNGCNSRFLILQNDAGLPFHVIGTEGGFLPAPVALTELLMSPAERMDVIMDFTGLAGKTVTLTNIGPDEPFGGGLPWYGDPAEVPEGHFPVADPFSTGLVMQFVVGPAVTPDLSTPVANLVLPAHIPLPTLDNPVRQLSLNELDSHSVFFSVDGVGNYIPDCDGEVFGPMEAQLGTMEPDPNDPTSIMPMAMEWMHSITENPAVGSTEIWEMFNFTMDAHPIHLHQVQFEVVERQSLMDPTMITPPEPWETGLKDTVIAYPHQITRIRAHFDLPGLYVWHCHIVEHEDNEMMRPFYIGDPPPDFPIPIE